MSERSFRWTDEPRVGVVVPAGDRPGRRRSARWRALLDAWGIHYEPLDRAPDEGFGTVLTPDLFPEEAAPDRQDEVADEALRVLESHAHSGLVALWRWPDAKAAALVVDGDVDHPNGVEPECTRYVAPAIETMRRAGFPHYGIFAAGANVEAEPDAFPPGAAYYNHSFTHPYSHWNEEPWATLSPEEISEELRRCDGAFRTHLGAGDHGLFRLPHFQWDAWERSASVLDTLGYRAESSVGGNRAVTGGLPYHPALTPWSDRPEDAAHLTTHADRGRRRAFLQLPIAPDPTDRTFPNGCCSYNTLGGSVRSRGADPQTYREVLQAVLDSEVARSGLAHLFIDPPDAGYGRLEGDVHDYAGAVERWLADATSRGDLAFMSPEGLCDWWIAREDAVCRLSWTLGEGRLSITLEDPPRGSSLALFHPNHGWTIEPLEEDPT